jgi:hypothetical protein
MDKERERRGVLLLALAPGRCKVCTHSSSNSYLVRVIFVTALKTVLEYFTAPPGWINNKSNSSVKTIEKQNEYGQQDQPALDGDTQRTRLLEVSAMYTLPFRPIPKPYG